MANEQDLNRDGKVDAKDAELLKKYDYNKDGQFTPEDFKALEAAYGADQSMDETIGNIAGGAGIGAGIGGAIGLIGGPAGAAAGAGIGALIGGGVGGIKNIADALTGNTGQQIEENTLKDMLVTAYGLTDENATKYIDSLKVMNEVNTKTNGRFGEINSKVSSLTKSVEKLSYLNNLKPGEKRDMAAYNKAVPESTGILPFGLGAANMAVMPVGVSKMTEEEAKAQHANEISSTLAELGITVDKAKIATMDTTQLNALLNTYKDENGLYAFPKLKLNVSLSTDEQKRFNDSFNFVNQTNATVDAGGATTTGAAAAKVLSDENTVTSPDGTVTTEKVYSDGTKEITTTNPDGTKSTVNIGAVDWASSGAAGGKNPTDYIYFGGSRNTFTVDANGNRIPAEATYKYQDATNFWQSNITDEAGILSMKKKLYAAGYYGASDIYSVMSANLTQTDIDALTRGMGDANIAGIGLEEMLAPKYESFLLTGRPAGDKPVDLNGDGVVDETVTGALGAFISRNGLKVSDGYLSSFETAIKAGTMTLDQAMKEIREKLIAPAYPAWSDYILDKGMDIADIASPYIETIAERLGLPSTAIGMNDPIIKQALSKAGADGKPSYTSLYDLDKIIRQDSRWESTDEAQKEYADYAQTILQQFGFM